MRVNSLSAEYTSDADLFVVSQGSDMTGPRNSSKYKFVCACRCLISMY